MKLLKGFFIVLLITAFSANVKAQVPTVDAITYNQSSQMLIVVEFSELLTWTSNGIWTFRIGGAPIIGVSLLSVSPSPQLIFLLPAPITFDDVQLGVTADYNGGGDFTNGSFTLAGFANRPAVNNNLFGCNHWR